LAEFIVDGFIHRIGSAKSKILPPPSTPPTLTHENFRKYKEIGFPDLDKLFQWWEEDHLAWDANDLLAMLWTWQHADISKNDTFKVIQQPYHYLL
jgi:hypothetical protein